MEKVSKLKNVQATGNFNELFKFELEFVKMQTAAQKKLLQMHKFLGIGYLQKSKQKA